MIIPKPAGCTIFPSANRRRPGPDFRFRREPPSSGRSCLRAMRPSRRPNNHSWQRWRRSRGRRSPRPGWKKKPAAGRRCWRTFCARRAGSSAPRNTIIFPIPFWTARASYCPARPRSCFFRRRPASGSLARQSGSPDVSADFPSVGVDHPFTRAAAGDQLTFVDSLAEDDPFRSLTRGGSPFLGAVSLPLRVKERLVGWIVFWNPLRSTPPQETERILLHEYAALVVAALEKNRSRAPAEAESAVLADELISLQNLDQELNSVSDPAEAIAITLDWAVRYADAAAGLAALIIDEALEIEAAIGYPAGAGPEEKSRLPFDSAGFQESIRSGEPFIRRAEGSVAPGLLSAGKTSMFLPIRRNTHTLGVLLLESDSENAFPPPAVEFLQRMASHAANRDLECPAVRRSAQRQPGQKRIHLLCRPRVEDTHDVDPGVHRPCGAGCRRPGQPAAGEFPRHDPAQRRPDGGAGVRL